MMSGDNFTCRSQKIRPVLGDLTNLPKKRGFSTISGELGSKSGDGHFKDMDSGNGNSELAKRVCVRVENLVKERCKTQCGDESSEDTVSMPKDKQSCPSSPVKQHNNITSLASDTPKEITEMPNLDVGIAHNVTELARDAYVSSATIPTCSNKECNGEDLLVSDVAHDRLLASHVCSDEDVGGDRLASNQSGSIELEKCAGLKNDDCMNSGPDSNSLKDCSCPFCLKAAYIWSDLHYQDIKGRIAALKKSQKEANFLVHKFGRGKQNEIPGQGNSDKSSNLEADLMNQWKSLFLHMEDIFTQESNQLEGSFITLKDMREHCKMDLERNSGMPSHKQ